MTLHIIVWALRNRHAIGTKGGWVREREEREREREREKREREERERENRNRERGRREGERGVDYLLERRPIS